MAPSLGHIQVPVFLTRMCGRVLLRATRLFHMIIFMNLSNFDLGKVYPAEYCDYCRFGHISSFKIYIRRSSPHVFSWLRVGVGALSCEASHDHVNIFTKFRSFDDKKKKERLLFDSFVERSENSSTRTAVKLCDLYSRCQERLGCSPCICKPEVLWLWFGIQIWCRILGPGEVLQLTESWQR